MYEQPTTKKKEKKKKELNRKDSFSLIHENYFRNINQRYCISLFLFPQAMNLWAAQCKMNDKAIEYS